MVVPLIYAIAWQSDPQEPPRWRTQHIKLVYRGEGVFRFKGVILDLSLKDEWNLQREIQGGENSKIKKTGDNKPSSLVGLQVS